MASLRNKKLIIAPNVQYEFPIRGNTVKVIDSSCVVYFKTQDGQIDFYLEKGERASFDNVNFLNLVIYHLETTDQKISISVGDGAEITSARVAGEVSVIDGSATRVNKERSFIAGVSCLAVAGQFSNIQLFNPINSGVNLWVDTVMMDGEFDGNCQLRATQTELSTLSVNGGNKKVNGAASLAKLKYESNAVAFPGIPYTGTALKAYQVTTFLIKDMFKVPPGWSLIVAAQEVNKTIRGSFQYFEEVI